MPARFQPAEITLQEVPGSTLKKLVNGDLTFTGEDGTNWTAPEGTLTDGASVPRIALGVTDGRFDAMFLKAAVVHDAYCQDDNMGRAPPFNSRSWRETHRMFYAASRAGGTPRIRARIMFAAVWWCGPRWGDPVAEAQRTPRDLAQIGLSATKRWIEREEPELEAIEADVEARELQILWINNIQMGAIGCWMKNELGKAQEGLINADILIAQGLARAPKDLMFLNLQGYQHKNWAMIRKEGKSVRLTLAEHVFNKVINAESQDASALNGLGSVAMLRENYDLAKTFIKRALEIVPDYDAALHDLRQIEDYEARLKAN